MTEETPLHMRTPQHIHSPTYRAKWHDQRCMHEMSDGIPKLKYYPDPSDLSTDTQDRWKQTECQVSIWSAVCGVQALHSVFVLWVVRKHTRETDYDTQLIITLQSLLLKTGLNKQLIAWLVSWHGVMAQDSQSCTRPISKANLWLWLCWSIGAGYNLKHRPIYDWQRTHFDFSSYLKLAVIRVNI